MSGDCIVRIVRGLPEGKVVTYGDISYVVYGHRNGGQAVGSAIKAETDKDRRKFPWWSVVFGDMRPKDDEARKRLSDEGVKFRDNRTVHPDYRHKLTGIGP